MTNEHITRFLSEYIDGTLSPAVWPAVERHLSKCKHCTNELNSMRTLVLRLNCLPKTIHPPADVLDDIEAKLLPPMHATVSPHNRKNGTGQLIQLHHRFSVLSDLQTIWFGKAAAVVAITVIVGSLWFILQKEHRHQIVTKPTEEINHRKTIPGGDESVNSGSSLPGNKQKEISSIKKESVQADSAVLTADSLKFERPAAVRDSAIVQDSLKKFQLPNSKQGTSGKFAGKPIGKVAND